MYKNFLCAVIMGCTFSVIFNHLLNVILGFIPRIYSIQNLNRHYRACPDNLDSRVTPEYDNEVVKSVGTSENGNSVAQRGRSMIEMLGVLAIIGVLSVGGIAGYSKAMMKIKLNRWQNDMTTLIANLEMTYINSLRYTDEDDKGIVNLYKELKIIPDGMLDSQNRDVYGNELRIYSHIPGGHSEWPSRLLIYFFMSPSLGSVEECRLLYDYVRDYENAWVVTLNEAQLGLGGLLSICGKSAAADYARYVHCVPYNLTEIASKCSVCEKQNCDIQLIINNGN